MDSRIHKSSYRMLYKTIGSYTEVKITLVLLDCNLFLYCIRNAANSYLFLMIIHTSYLISLAFDSIKPLHMTFTKIINR